jgi:hypothetical protein
VREEAAQRVLLIRAVEEADRDGRLLTPQERVQATVAARGTAAEDPAVALERRASRLLDALAARAPWVGSLLNATRLPSAVAWGLPVVAVALGLLTDALGPARRINILSVPLLGLIVWNAGVYAALAVLWLARAGRSSRPRPAPTPGASGVFAGLVAAWSDWRGRRRIRPRTEGARLAGEVVSLYVARWRRAAAPLLEARVRFLLHLGAALLGVGVLCGAYARGIAFEYEATWESTFLGPRGLRAILVVLLGPAAALLGESIPPPPALAALRAPAAGEAAPWVHRYALTTLLVVIAPRGLLAAAALGRARRLAADLPLDVSDPYFTRLTAGARARAAVEVMPYGMKLTSRGGETLRALLHELVGASAEVRVEPEAAYGAEPGEVLPPTPAGRGSSRDGGLESWRILVFSLAQSPEDEVHGALLIQLADWVAGGESGSRRGLAVVDASPYRLRLAGTGAETQRIAERQRAWNEVAQRAGATVAHLELADGSSGDEPLTHMQRGVWPPLSRA